MAYNQQKAKRNNFNKSLAQKLGLVKDEIKVTKAPNIAAVNQSSIDGVHHINIWENADTELGVGLSHMTDAPFEHPEFGPFASVEGFWQWLRDASHDDRHRTTHGRAARNGSRDKEICFVDNFRYKIMMANWYKVQTYDYFKDELKKSELPFEMYYVFKEENGIKVRPSPAYWLIAGFEEIRRAVKEDREPNFDYLLHDRSESAGKPYFGKHNYTAVHDTASLTREISERNANKKAWKPRKPQLLDSSAQPSRQEIKQGAKTMQSFEEEKLHEELLDTNPSQQVLEQIEESNPVDAVASMAAFEEELKLEKD